MIMTQHFRDRWIERLGGRPPDPEELDDIIRNSLKIQHQRTLYQRRGRQFLRYQVLETWANFERGIVIRVDRDAMPPAAVTIITKDMGTWK